GGFTDYKETWVEILKVENNLPNAFIDYPSVCTAIAPCQYKQGYSISFMGRGMDLEDGILTGESLIWTSDISGQIGTGTNLSVNNLALGKHTIRLTVKDSGGFTDYKETWVEILKVENNLPNAFIDYPSVCTAIAPCQYKQGNSVVFMGRGVDTEDGTLTGESLIWTSDISGQIGTGTNLSVNNLALGKHTIRLTVKDSGSLIGFIETWIEISADTSKNNPPTAEIFQPNSTIQCSCTNPCKYSRNEYVLLNGRGTDIEDGNLPGSSLSWYSNINGPLKSDTGSYININDLAIGEHIITLIAKDSNGVEGFASVCIQILNNSLPTGTILSPSHNSSFSEGDNIIFACKGTDPEDGDLGEGSFLWYSSIDGEITNTNSLSFQKNDLKKGKHKIILKATDSNGGSSLTSVDIAVGNYVPNAYIDLPAGCSSNSPCQYKQGSNIFFMGRGIDTEDGTLTGSNLIWTSNIKGQIGTNTSVSVNNLAVGTHNIKLSVKDLVGATAFAETWIQILKDSTQNTSPTATIESPMNICSSNSPCQYNKGDYVTITGRGDDTEDGMLSSNQLSWYSSIDGGPIGTGAFTNIASLSSGTHTITLVAKDSDDAYGAASIYIKILNNSLPTVEILRPSNNTYFELNENIVFVGSAFDAEDGYLNGTSVGTLSWFSNLEMIPIGTEETFSRTLSKGKHTIILTAKDKDGGTSSNSISIRVDNNAPTAQIDYPSGCSTTLPCSYYKGSDVFLLGRAIDNEDGVLTGNSLVWTSDINGNIGTGTSVTINSLAVGTHKIKLTSTDSNNEINSAEVSILIKNENDPAKNTAPTASMNAPNSSTTCTCTNPCKYNLGQKIILNGAGIDAEDGVLPSNNLSWYSNIDGKLDVVNYIPTIDLSAGTHKITLVAKDSNESVGTDSMCIEIINTNPNTPIITVPETGSTFNAGVTIIFAGTAYDKEDGDLPGTSLTWHSNRENGIIGTGNYLPFTLSTVGIHTITLIAKDKSGASSMTSIEITVN
ncbi:MAG: hypothetical protein HQK76_17585, partial [Desulfobacterales bacterium]|nr:hypothetical protein [Desulfobacterales bacterium]